MPRAVSVLLAVGSILATAAAAPRQAGGGAPARGAIATLDDTPSDPTAIGFLQSVVDPRVYSLDSIGTTRLASRIRATFDVTDPLAKQPSTSLDLDLDYDYATGALSIKPTLPPSVAQQPIVVHATNAAQNALSQKPSRAAAVWRVTFQQDGDEIRLDYFPRNLAGLIESYSEWHRQDGTPLRRRVKSRVPQDGVLTTVTQEIAFDYEEVDRRLLLKELKPVEAHGSQFSFRFEYAAKDGVNLLKKLVQENQGWRLTLEFESKIERATERAPKR
ncbi:MAG: hypothetical protein EXS13_12970 [Planctomycetes bacterium]|nr:hypothetical protein [Planctomycetota bacterium]